MQRGRCTGLAIANQSAKADASVAHATIANVKTAAPDKGRATDAVPAAAGDWAAGISAVAELGCMQMSACSSLNVVKQTIDTAQSTSLRLLQLNSTLQARSLHFPPAVLRPSLPCLLPATWP